MHPLNKTLQSPELGLWYQLPDLQIFKIIAMDNDDETIEIQYFDGAIEEWESDNWYRTDIEAIEEPEDWSGPYDEIDNEDLGYDEFTALLKLNGSPIDNLD